MMWIKFLQLLFKFKCSLMQQMLLAMGGGGAAANPPVFDAVTTINGQSAGSPTSTLTVSHTCTGTNRGLIVGFWWSLGAITSKTVTYAGVGMTLIGEQTFSAGSITLSQYKLSNPASGANNIVMSFTGDIAEVLGGAVSFTNCHQTTASLTGTQAKTSGTSGNPSIDVTSGSNEIVVDAMGHESDLGETVSADSGQTERWNALRGASGYRGAGSTEAGAGTVTMSWTPSAAITDWGIVGVSVKAP